jgi:phytoene dehydrogenase-like protein
MQQPHAVIIGSGVAGMATAIRLAVQGYRVGVYEKNAAPGGKLTAFDKDGYRFDAGPSLFTQPTNLTELFAYAGEPIEAYFQYEKVPVSCHYFFDNGKTVKAYTDADALASEMEEALGEDPKAVQRYLNDAAALYNNVGTVF